MTGSSGSTFYGGVQAATQTGNTRPYVAKFDIAVTDTTPNSTNGYLTRVPQTGNQIGFSKDLSDDTVSITFTTTGNSLDSYLYFRYNGTFNFDTDGFVTGTACGVREAMEVAYPTSTTQNGNQITAVFTVLYGAAGFTKNSFVVIAHRDCTSLGIQCYENVYYRVDVSEGWMLRGMGWGMMMLFVFLGMLFV